MIVNSLEAGMRGVLVVAALSGLLLTTARPAHAQTENILHRFDSIGYGYNFMSSLTADREGNFYGTTDVGGRGYGTAFELSPDGRGGWHQTVLHTFTDGKDGGYPFFSTLTVDRRGNLYGTTSNGGNSEFGVVFKLHPVGKRWVETVLFNFSSGPGGVYPFNGLIMDAAGNLYGRDYVYTEAGIFESVFELSGSKQFWTEKVIYQSSVFTGNVDGGGLTMDDAGDIFGVTWDTFAPSIAFELTPNGSGGWNTNTIYTFEPSADPFGPPALDKAGNLYGVVTSSTNYGTVYELSPRKTGGWLRKTLYRFNGSPTDGGDPYAGVTFDASGNIYGTTSSGGLFNLGTVFELTPPADQSGYREKILWSFNGADGSAPLGNVVLDAAGDVYGLTSTGGGAGCYGFEGCGVAFEVVPSNDR
jgi:uncharacterized repeat protein (TIGR03803 family)